MVLSLIVIAIVARAARRCIAQSRHA